MPKFSINLILTKSKDIKTKSTAYSTNIFPTFNFKHQNILNSAYFTGLLFCAVI